MMEENSIIYGPDSENWSSSIHCDESSLIKSKIGIHKQAK